MLEGVKEALGITGNYQDKTIQRYIDEVIQFLVDGGVSKKIQTDSNAVGIVARGVADLWNYGSGSTGFSPYFLQRATQLSLKEEKKESDKDV